MKYIKTIILPLLFFYVGLMAGVCQTEHNTNAKDKNSIFSNKIDSSTRQIAANSDKFSTYNENTELFTQSNSEYGTENGSSNQSFGNDSLRIFRNIISLSYKFNYGSIIPRFSYDRYYKDRLFWNFRLSPGIYNDKRLTTYKYDYENTTVIKNPDSHKIFYSGLDLNIHYGINFYFTDIDKKFPNGAYAGLFLKTQVINIAIDTYKSYGESGVYSSKEKSFFVNEGLGTRMGIKWIVFNKLNVDFSIGGEYNISIVERNRFFSPIKKFRLSAFLDIGYAF